MKSKVELFNLALGRLGIRPLTGTEDARTEAVFCNQFFDSALEEVLAMAPTSSTSSIFLKISTTRSVTSAVSLNGVVSGSSKVMVICVLACR